MIPDNYNLTIQIFNLFSSCQTTIFNPKSLWLQKNAYDKNVNLMTVVLQVINIASRIRQLRPSDSRTCLIHHHIDIQPYESLIWQMMIVMTKTNWKTCSLTLHSLIYNIYIVCITKKLNNSIKYQNSAAVAIYTA